MDRKIIELDQGWEYMDDGITKLKRILEGLSEPPFSSEEYMMLYTYPFFDLICTHNYSLFKHLSFESLMFVHCDCISLIPSIEQSITCVPRSLLTITPNSSMTSTVRRLRNILFRRYEILAYFFFFFFPLMF
jgi:hypothetical protein